MAASQKRGGAAVAEQHLVAVGQGEQLGQPVAQRAHLELHPRPGGGRCRGSRGPAAASAATASGRTLEGPQPKRPSAGSRSAGILISGSGGVTVP